jgi:hypothetical protein
LRSIILGTHLQNNDADKMSHEFSSVKQVTEFGQTETGNWYPRKIESQRISRLPETDSTSFEGYVINKQIDIIYVDTDPNLTKEMFRLESLSN